MTRRIAFITIIQGFRGIENVMILARNPGPSIPDTEACAYQHRDLQSQRKFQKEYHSWRGRGRGEGTAVGKVSITDESCRDTHTNIDHAQEIQRFIPSTINNRNMRR